MSAEATVSFTADGLRLEGMLAAPPGADRGVVVCHPHPQYGGDMDNNVVCGLVTALVRAGVATLRFNFRGVGESEGNYAGGTGETNDARAAAELLAQRGLRRVSLAGYSFGAIVALRAGYDHPAVERLIAIAPPLGMFDVAFLAGCEKPKLFLVGDRDQFCSATQMERTVASLPGQSIAHRLVGADHFLGGFETEIADAVVRFVTATEDGNA